MMNSEEFTDKFLAEVCNATEDGQISDNTTVSDVGETAVGDPDDAVLEYHKSQFKRANAETKADIFFFDVDDGSFKDSNTNVEAPNDTGIRLQHQQRTHTSMTAERIRTTNMTRKNRNTLNRAVWPVPSCTWNQANLLRFGHHRSETYCLTSRTRNPIISTNHRYSSIQLHLVKMWALKLH